MTNVLPSTTRTELRTMLRARIVLVGALMCALAAFVSIVSLAPALLAVTIPLMTEYEELTESAKQQMALYEESRAQASRTRARLAALTPFAEERVHVQPLIAKIYALRPSSVTIEMIKYHSGEKGQIVVTGTSQAREPVNDFRTALVHTSMFDGVSVPVAALVGALEGHFSMTLTGDF